ncbi:hypothetical protein LCGC14_1108730 [marine sediment metagenome]|uniref:DUF1508 domain-containing protein n=1 Tax=marine sediment metagenome TaxID=412755 RepID=A0A0F9PQK0_9ZZZZ
MSTEETGTITNRYVTVRTVNSGTEFYVNTIRFDGEVDKLGPHSYFHKRSARRAAIALAKKLDVSYRQDLEYFDNPQAFTAVAIA